MKLSTQGRINRAAAGKESTRWDLQEIIILKMIKNIFLKVIKWRIIIRGQELTKCNNNPVTTIKLSQKRLVLRTEHSKAQRIPSHSVTKSRIRRDYARNETTITFIINYQRDTKLLRIIK